GAGLFGRLESEGRARSIGGGNAAAVSTGRKTRTADKAFGGLSPAGSPPLAQSRPRHAASQGSARHPGRMEKKTLPEELAAVLTAEAVRGRPIRLMFRTSPVSVAWPAYDVVGRRPPHDRWCAMATSANSLTCMAVSVPCRANWTGA